MFKDIKSGLTRAIVMLVVFSSVAFAFQVSGTIKTWTTGETLTAADLNTTVQSLKTAVEGATQLGQIIVPRRTLVTGIIYSSFLSSNWTGSTAVSIEPQNPMLRSGTVKSVRMDILESINAACTITLRKNGADTAVQFNYVANTTAPMTDSDTVSFVSTDILTWKTDCPSAYGLNALLSFEF